VKKKRSTPARCVRAEKSARRHGTQPISSLIYSRAAAPQLRPKEEEEDRGIKKNGGGGEKRPAIKI